MEKNRKMNEENGQRKMVWKIEKKNCDKFYVHVQQILKKKNRILLFVYISSGFTYLNPNISNVLVLSAI